MSSKITKKKIAAHTPTVSASLLPEGEFNLIPIDEIDASPLNYRKVFPVAKMEELAASIAQNGIISNLTVRVLPSGRNELVAGERRLRAAKMAGVMEVPAIVTILSDEQVRQIQLAENLQREDPHPLEEAEAIGQLLTVHKTIDEIAVRLGKSKAFVYSRLKLRTLIPNIQEMFVGEKFTLREVLEIAALSPQSQQGFYDEYCADWREEEFEAPELSYVLDQFKYDLTEAPFNTKDKNLLPEAGACTKCPYNTATLKTLFPEEATEAVCTNTGCYQRKCLAHFSIGFRSALEEHEPVALLFYGSPSSFLKNVIQGQPEAASLPQYNYHGITIVREPEIPNEEDYILETETEEAEDTSEPDTDGFAQAMEEYQTDLEEYQQLLGKGAAQKALLMTERELTAYLFSPEARKQYSSGPAAPTVTAAEVQAAIKAGKATPELLQAEISRITNREIRSKELDREKVPAKLQEQFVERVSEIENNTTLTAADLTGARLLIFQSLDYSVRHKVSETLFSQKEGIDAEQKETFFDILANLTDEQYSYLIRMAVAAKPESKYASNTTAYFLYRMAESAGVDIATIEKEQQGKTEARQKNQAGKIKELEKKIKKMQPKE